VEKRKVTYVPSGGRRYILTCRTCNAFHLQSGLGAFRVQSSK
jgi:hypothetical protein